MPERHTYRLKFDSTLEKPAPDIEFKADDAYQALFIIHKMSRRRPTELLQNGKRICTIQQIGGGAWQISPLAALVDDEISETEMAAPVE